VIRRWPAGSGESPASKRGVLRKPWPHPQFHPDFQEDSLKSIYIAVAVATGLAMGVTGATFAAAPPAPAPSTTTTFTLSAADAATFKTWVGTQKTAKVAVPTGLTVAVGTVLPMTITLVDIPATAKAPPLPSTSTCAGRQDCPGRSDDQENRLHRQLSERF
jgi:hypothetical protein